MPTVELFRVYLAGRFIKYRDYSDWRDYFKHTVRSRLYDAGRTPLAIGFYDPRHDTKQGLGFANFNYEDRKGVLNSDMVFCFDATPDGAQEDPGMVNEATIGVEHGKVVVFCTEMSVIHPMFGNYCSGAIAIGMDAGVDYVMAFAKHGIQSLEVYHEMIEKRKQLIFG